jgi:release factor glutamine methyltransferase
MTTYMEKTPAVYILANQRNGTLYVGLTSDLLKRVWQHKTKAIDGFSTRYNVSLLVYYEQHETMEAAIKREKRLKEWQRKWKLELIESVNPDWEDLYEGFFEQPIADAILDPAVKLRDDSLSVHQTLLTQRLVAAKIDSAAVDAKLLMAHGLSCDRAALVSQSERALSSQEREAIEVLAAQRIARMPISQILGYKDFWQDRFIVSADVLTPRPDSETLIEAMLDYRPKRDAAYDILDLGTGSGCLLLSLLREYPNALGLGIDQSAPALAIATQNAQALGLQARASFSLGHWMQTLQSRYDMVISNPPYIERAEIDTLEPEVKEHEPMAALSGGDDGLDAYRQILASLPKVLNPNGICVMEFGAGQEGAVAALATECGLKVREIKEDLAAIPRAIIIEQH